MKSAVFMWRPVGGLRHQERDVDPLGQPFVRGDTELPDRLLVPAIAGVGERPAQIDGVGEVETGGAVVHEVDAVANMGS